LGSQSVSIHAHFYQPPRQDPITGLIQQEPSASPFSNWNERIHAECYRPNAELRNFERISFNIGPTLFSWLREHNPQTCDLIYEQDHYNVHRNGVGNAIAQAYNHTILPLSSYQDKVTQIYWGIADFQKNFRRQPTGIWLPETAIDMETLEVIARMGIQFTILAPWQANTQDLDTSQPYNVILPDKKQVTVFFYHRDLSARISFDPGATNNADWFAETILLPNFGANISKHDEPQILIIASDGELYGHHQRMRDLFLAHLVDGACSQLNIQNTYPALWLLNHPVQETVNILEQTSWSCHHGIIRWRGNCDCTNSKNAWKSKLRFALDNLADELDALYLEVVKPVVKDPWKLRNHFIHVLLGQMTFDELIMNMSGGAFKRNQENRIYLMLESQYQRQLMFTSCGWFFEDFDRIEPRNNLAHAAQAVLLARLATDVNLEPKVVIDLKQVTSENSGLRGDTVFQNHLQRAQEEGFINVKALPNRR